MKKTISLVVASAVFLAGVFVLPAEAKNARNKKTFSVTGNGSNSDAAVSYVGGISTSINYYRRIAYSGLKMSNPLPFRVFRQGGSDENFGEENWNTTDHYFIANGNLWVHYGNGTIFGGNTTYSDYQTGTFKYLGYFGGTKKKKRKNSAFKTYQFAVSGTESDPDTTAKAASDDVTYYYRKVNAPEFDLGNLADFRLFSQNDFPNGYTAESWMTTQDDYFVANGAFYVAYGYKRNNTFSNFGDATYRLFLYSDGKRKRNRLTKQYVKRYDLSIPNDPVQADKVTTIDYGDGFSSVEYYKKLRIPGGKLTDFPNLKVMRRNNFTSGFSDESWTERGYKISNGYIWINFGSKSVDNGVEDEYSDIGSGDYRIFSYR